jgi:VWFA-related protein
MKLSQIPAFVLIALAGVCVLRAQDQEPRQQSPTDEIQVGSRAWTPPAGTIRVESNVVEVGVVVRDKQGKPVPGLKRDDFKIFDEGKEQPISQFAEERAPGKQTIASGTPQPVAETTSQQTNFVAMLFDDIDLPPPDFNNARAAAVKLIQQGLQPNDRVAILTVVTGTVLEFTADKAKLLAALQNITPRYQPPTQGSTACPRITPYQAYLMRLYGQEHSDSLDLAIAQAQQCASSCQGREMVPCLDGMAENVLGLAERNAHGAIAASEGAISYLAKMRGRRVLLLTSSGFLTETLGADQDKVIQNALRENVVINSLDAKGLAIDPVGDDYSEGGPPIVLSTRNDLQAVADRLRKMTREVMDDPMSVLAVGTGGTFYRNSNDLSAGFRELVETPDVTYFLGFSPQEINANGKYHRLSVKLVNSQDETVEARRGYFAPAKERHPQETAADKQAALDREVEATDSITDINAQLDALPVQSPSGAGVKIGVHVDLANLPYMKRGDRSVERLIIVTALFDSQGGFLTGQETIMDLKLKDDTRRKLASEGIDAKLSMQLASGSYRLRSVVQEEAGGRMGAVSKDLQIQ